MAIAITIDAAVGIETYDGLQDFLTEHLELSATTVTQLPNLIRMAEYRLNRLLASPERETSATLSTVAGTQGVALPASFVALRQARVIGTSTTGYPLDFVSLAGVEALDYSGRPVVCAVLGSDLLLGPVPDAVYSIEVRYQEKLDFLSDTNTTNWLLVDHADAYVYMCASVISLHHGDKEMAGLYFDVANGVVDEINKLALRQWHGGTLRPIVACVP